MNFPAVCLSFANEHLLVGAQVAAEVGAFRVPMWLDLVSDCSNAMTLQRGQYVLLRLPFALLVRLWSHYLRWILVSERVLGLYFAAMHRSN